MKLVTGGTGFVGANIIAGLLINGHEVRALKRTNSSLNQFRYILSLRAGNKAEILLQKLHWFEADILDIPALESAFENIDEVYHSAALVSFSPADQADLEEINVKGTANMVNLSLDFNVKKFGFVSSIAALGRTHSGEHINEEHKWEDSKDNSRYGISKHRAEMEVWRGIHEGLNAVIVNPGVILGEGDWDRGSCKIFKTIYSGMPFYGEGINGYVDVQDVSGSLIKLMESEVSGKRFILVSDNKSLKDLFSEIALEMKKSPPQFPLTKLTAAAGWRAIALWSFFTGKKPLITKETTSAAFRKYYYSSDLIKKELGYEFISLSETIKRTSKAFLMDQK